MPDLINQEYIQWGFAGFAFALLGIIVWMFKQLLVVVKENNKVLARLFDALHANTQCQDDTKAIVKEGSAKIDNLRERLLARPCLRGNDNDTH